MREVVDFLQANPVQYLATVGRDGKAKCRPFMFCLEKDGKLWFCTNSQKDVYMDMQQNPEVEVSVSDAAFAWLRLHGRAVFQDNMEVKEACMANPIVKGQYGTAANPIFRVFYLADAEAVISPVNRPELTAASQRTIAAPVLRVSVQLQRVSGRTSDTGCPMPSWSPVLALSCILSPSGCTPPWAEPQGTPSW